MRHFQEEDPEAREYRLYMSRQLIRFLQSRLLLQPLEERLGTDSNYRIEKEVLKSNGSTNRVKKIRRLEISAGIKFLRPAEAIVDGLSAKYRHPLFKLLREDVHWSTERVWRLFCQLPPEAVGTLFEGAGPRPQKPLTRRLQGAHRLRGGRPGASRDGSSSALAGPAT